MIEAYSWQYKALLVAGSFLVDLAVGDPPRLPHPVVQIGRLIQVLEQVLRRPHHPPWLQRLAGVVLAVVVPAVSAAAAGVLVWAAGLLHPAAGGLLAVWLASTTVAARGLALAGGRVLAALRRQDLPQARQQVGEIVGRDTAALDEAEVTRAAVETVAENCVDACVAPLLFTLLGGAPGALLYRAINTLDSMVGYKNERYLHFGWAAARLDDFANWVPARITALLLPLAAACHGGDPRAAWRMIRRDASKHPSPNSGIPEAGVAGALGVQLGGMNSYGGVKRFRALMGDPRLPLVPEHISQATRIMLTTALLSVIVFTLLGWAVAAWTA